MWGSKLKRHSAISNKRNALLSKSKGSTNDSVSSLPSESQENHTNNLRMLLPLLDHFHAGVIIVDQKYEILFRNKQAEKFLTGTSVFSVSYKNRLSLVSKTEGAELRHLIDQCFNTSDQHLEKQFFTPTTKGHDHPLLLEITKLKALNSNIEAIPPAAVIFIADPMADTEICVSGIQQVYQLSDAEAEVCAMLAMGSTPNQVAEKRQTTISTTRTQIKTLLLKTGSQSKTDLIRLTLKLNQAMPH